MAPKSESLPTGILRLSKLLSHLNTPPKLKLSGVKALRLSLASKNDHFGARHFVKSELPRIRYANPTLDVQVQHAVVEKTAQWRPVMELDLEDGTTQKLDLQDKWSTTILKELMDVAGGDHWKRYVTSSQLAGLPPIPGERAHRDEEKRLKARREKEGKKGPLPTLQEYLKANPDKVVDKSVEKTSSSKNKTDKKFDKTSSTPPPLVPESTTEATS